MVADQQRDPVRVVWTEVVAKKVVLPGIRSSHLSDRAGQVAGRVSDWQQRPTVEASRREDGSDCAEVCLTVFLHLVPESHRPVARVSIAQVERHRHQSLADLGPVLRSRREILRGGSASRRRRVRVQHLPM